MSKVVTIPKDRNPFVVIVNGVKHSYPAGVTTEVPDEVADVIEKYEGAKPKPDPNAGINFGSAQSDWNQTDSSAADFIKNKPFGDMPTGGDTLYWDGNYAGAEIIFDAFIRVREEVFDINDLTDEGITFTELTYNQSFTLTKSEAMGDAMVTDDGFFMNNIICIVPYDNYDLTELAGESLVVAKKGIYIMAPYAQIPYAYKFHGLTIFPYIKKVDDKYVNFPAHILDLYGGTDEYLYHSDNYDDVENRVTKAEFEEIMQRYSSVRIHRENNAYVGFAVGYSEYTDHYQLRIETASGGITYYTAEYTPTT